MRKIFLLLLLFPSLLVSQSLSHLKLQDVRGKEFVMKDHLSGDATIVAFWATWCLPCKKEFKALDKLQKKYPDKKINIITISRDTPRSLAKVKSFVKSHKYNFIYLVDPGGDVSSKLLVTSVPYTMLLDSTGKVFYSHLGYRKGDEAQLEKQLLTYWHSKKTRPRTGEKK